MSASAATRNASSSCTTTGSPLRGRAGTQSQVQGTLRISTSVAFGRRVLAPMVLDFMRDHALLTVDLSFDDRYVNLVEQGVDVAVRMGRLADSSLGATYLGNNPGSWSRRPLTWNGAARRPARRWPITRRWSPQHRAGRRHLAFRRRRRADPGHSGEERLRSNNLSVLLDAARDGFSIAVCHAMWPTNPAPRGHPAAAGGLAPARPGDPRGVSVAAHGAGQGAGTGRVAEGQVQGRVVARGRARRHEP